MSRSPLFADRYTPENAPQTIKTALHVPSGHSHSSRHIIIEDALQFAIGHSSPSNAIIRLASCDSFLRYCYLRMQPLHRSKFGTVNLKKDELTPDNCKHHTIFKGDEIAPPIQARR